MKRRTMALALGAALALSLGCAAGEAVPVEEEGDSSLVIYTSHVDEVSGPIIKEFQERTGIWVRVETGGSNELLERIAAESEAPACDVVFGGGAESHQAFSPYLEPYRSGQLEAVKGEYCSAEDRWTPFSALPIVLIYNTRLVERDKAPQSWEEMLDGRWSGQIAYADPGVSASCYTALTTLMQAGPGGRWQNGSRFAAVLEGNLLTGSSQIVKAVADGEYPVGISLEEAALRQLDAGGAISVVYPTDGTSVVPDATSLVRGSPHPENAKAFIDFTLSRDTQQMIVTEFGRRPVRADVEQPRRLMPLEEIAQVEYDFDWAGASRGEILARWRETMG